jgi:hypothetical protein
MFLKPKIIFSKSKDKKRLMYFFKDRAQFERCIASGCKFISRDNVFEESEFTFFMDFISSLAIEIWRLEKRFEKVKDDMTKGEKSGITSISDQIQRIKDVFKKQEVEICEHTGTAYNDGLSLKVLHIEEIDELLEGKMQIIETIKPSVYLKGKVIFLGEVIVGKSKKNKRSKS